MSTEYVRKQLALILKEVMKTTKQPFTPLNRAQCLDAIQRLADGLDGLEPALKRLDAAEAKLGAFPAMLKALKDVETWLVVNKRENSILTPRVRAAIVAAEGGAQ